VPACFTVPGVNRKRAAINGMPVARAMRVE
jgi:hypothetical protein